MGIDLGKLSQSQLLQLINATPLGTVLTRSRLRRQMDAGAYRFGDGNNINFIRYVGWLVAESHKPPAAKIDYIEAKKRQAQRNRAATKASQDIAPIPPVDDFARRMACQLSFQRFCETYFATAFHRAWSDDHLKVIGKIERAVLEGGLLAFAFSRGAGKTSLARCAAIWSVLYGHRPFVCLIGAADDRAKELLLPIKKHFLENPLLLGDFPEAIWPLRALENSSKRQLQQHCNGRLTHVHWGQGKIVLPTIDPCDLPECFAQNGLEASPSSGSIITATSLEANIRGQQHTRADGSIIRPSLVLLDDPQTRESARSSDQTKKRLELLNGDVLGMAGPGEQISALITCTKMYENDLADTILNPEKSPEWDGQCSKLMYAMPTDEKLWDRYFEIRTSKGREAANEFYRDNQVAMDAGGIAGWRERFDPRSGEISAIQHAMNLRRKVGVEAFAAEYQNDPATPQVSDQAITVDQVCQKISGHKRGEIPVACTKMTMFIDVHDKLLFFMVCAWDEFFGGQIVDYGTFPAQNRNIFTLTDSSQTLSGAFPGRGIDGAIHAGLEKLITTYLRKQWNKSGSLMVIDRLLVDMGYKPGIVADVKRTVGGSAMVLSKGVGIRAARKPLAAYARRPGEVHGHYWYMPNVRKTGQFQHVLIDVNYWKRFVHEGFATATGDRGSIAIFGKDVRQHELLAEHIARSEKWVEVTGPHGTIREWSCLPTRPDNHWFDCMVGCAAAASMCGIKASDEGAPARQRKRYTQQDLLRR